MSDKKASQVTNSGIYSRSFPILTTNRPVSRMVMSGVCEPGIPGSIPDRPVGNLIIFNFPVEYLCRGI